MKNQLFPARAFYLGAWAIFLMLAGLSEAEILPTQYITPTAESMYAITLTCILMGIGGTWISLRLFTFPGVKKQIQTDESKKQLCRWNNIRTTIMSVAILFNLATYYATLHTTPLYCMLIAIVGFVFCWPKDGEA